MTTTHPVVFDPYDHAAQDDPYPIYARLRERAPFHHDPERGFWVLSRHADVSAALRDESTFSNRMGVSIDPASWGPQARYAMSFLAMDPPEQTRLRALVSRGFTPRRVKELEPRIQALTDEYLRPLLNGDAFDFIDEFAGRLPMDVISEMMGVPKDDRAELRRLADLLIARPEGSRDVPQAGIDAAMTLLGYFQDAVAERRRRPGDDLVSALVQAESDGDHLADSEIVGFALLMIVAGNETTTKLLGNCLYWGARNPDQLGTVFADPQRAPSWVNETLRFDSSTQLLARYLLTDVERYGVVAPAGSQVALLLGSANRDPAVFPDPDRYDLDRDTSQLISFGAGRHYCLGASLARLEANVVLSTLARLARSLEVDETGSERIHSVNVRGFAHLPVRIEGR